MVFKFEQLKSTKDINKILDSLTVNDVPKLDRPVLSMLYNFILSTALQEMDEEFLTALKIVVKIVDHAVKNFTYSNEDWNAISSGLASLNHCILNMITLNPLTIHPQNSALISQVVDVFLPMITKSSNLKNLVIDLDGSNLAKLICWEDLTFSVRAVAITNFNLLVKECSHEQRKQFIVKNSSWMDELASLLPNLGDYVSQEILSETLLRMAMATPDWKASMKTWFAKCPFVLPAIEALNLNQFGTNNRRFLNCINRCVSPPCRVYTLVSLQCTGGNEQLHKPKGYDEMWVDCSCRTGDIHMVCDGGFGSWVRVTLKSLRIKSILCKAGMFTRAEEKIESVDVEIQLSTSIVIPLEPVEARCSSFLLVFKKDSDFVEAETHFFKIYYSKIYKWYQEGVIDETRALQVSSTASLASRRNSLPSTILTSPMSSITRLSTHQGWTSSNASTSVHESTKKFVTSTPQLSRKRLPNLVLTKTQCGDFVSTLVKNKGANLSEPEGVKATTKRSLYTPGEDDYLEEVREEPSQKQPKYFPCYVRPKRLRKKNEPENKTKKKGKFQKLCVDGALEARMRVDVLRSAETTDFQSVEANDHHVTVELDVVNVSVEHPPQLTENFSYDPIPASPPPPPVEKSRKKTRGLTHECNAQPQTKSVAQTSKSLAFQPIQEEVAQAIEAEGTHSTNRTRSAETLFNLNSVNTAFTSQLNAQRTAVQEICEEVGNIQRSASNIQRMCGEALANFDEMGSTMNSMSGHLQDLISAVHSSDPRHVPRVLRSIQTRLTKVSDAPVLNN